MLDTVKRTISDYMMLETGENVLVALSGGADSTALLLSLRELGYPVRAFHLNHCLRGAESDRDEAFCRRLCEKTRRGTDGRARGHSHCRRRFRGGGDRAAYSLCTAGACRARSQNRGGAQCGRQSGDYAVPFGARHRCERSHGHSAGARTHHSASSRLNGGKSKPFCASADRILSQTARTRTRLIRATASVKRSFPVLRELNPQAAQAAARLSRQLRQDETCLQSYAQTCVQLCAVGNGAWKIQPLREAAPAVRSRALRLLLENADMPLKDVTAKHITALEHLLETASPSAETDLPNGYFARREYDVLRIIPKAETAVERPEIPLTPPFAGTIWKDTVKLAAKK